MSQVETLPAGEQPSAVYRSAANHTAGTVALPAPGALAPQDIYLEVPLPGSPGSASAQATGGMQQGQQYTYYLIAKAGLPFYMPE